MRRRFFRLDGWRTVERDVDDELAFHVDARVAELSARGLAPEAAREAALREFGDLAAARAELGEIDRRMARGARRAEWWEAAWHDLRYAARGLGRERWFTAVVVLTLALGIGANATMFGVVDHLLFRTPPHLRDPGSLRRVYLLESLAGAEARVVPVVGFPTVGDLRDGARGTYDAAAFDHVQLFLGSEDRGEPLRAAFAEASVFPLLGVRPALGRFFGEDESRPGEPHRVAVLDHGFWRRHYDGRRDAIGARLELNGERYTVIGVAPEGFGGLDYQATDVWLPVSAFQRAGGGATPWQAQRNIRSFTVVMRLRASDAAAAEAATAAFRAGESAAGGPGAARAAATRVQLGPVIEARGPQAAPQQVGISTRLAGVAVVVLLVTCANVANLLLARAMRRRREIAVRLALGIGRGRLVRQLLTEGVLLAALGGGAALLVAQWGGQAMRALLFPELRWTSAPVDGRVLAFTAAVALLAGLLAGLAPAAQGGRHDVVTGLRDGWSGVGPARRATARRALLVVQAALSLMLLTGAGLFVRSLRAVRAQELGLDADRLVGVDVTHYSDQRPPAAVSASARDLAQRVRAMPEVERASLTSGGPFSNLTVKGLGVPGRDLRDLLRSLVNEPVFQAVDPDYFAASGLALVRGRSLDAGDVAGAPPVMVVNERAAAALWPAGDALRSCVRIGRADDLSLPCASVVGIVRNAHVQELVEAPKIQLYAPLAQAPDDPPATLLVRARPATARDPGAMAALAARLRAELRRTPGVPARADVYLLAERLEPQLRPWRLGAALFGAFGMLALVIAAVGCYSVLAYVVAQRTRELGVRLALGARTGSVMRLVVGEGLRLTALGVLIGLAGALAAGRLLAALLFGTSPRDPAALAGAALLLLVVAILASLIPAWRAARVDPTVALRAD